MAGGEVIGAEVLVHEAVAVHLSQAGFVTHWKYLDWVSRVERELMCCFSYSSLFLSY